MLATAPNSDAGGTISGGQASHPPPDRMVTKSESRGLASWQYHLLVDTSHVPYSSIGRFPTQHIALIERIQDGAASRI
ncbi:hypothetical protein OMCYN_01720 [cyanobiont of Ornithocercus magnificus]|nr:hypothetical protein OMCYN_01720 [cyanobiont of Ornithocercus magnificus]